MHNLLLALLLLTFGGCAAKLTHDDLPLKNPQKGGVIYFLPTDGYGEIYQEKNDTLVKITRIGIIDGRLTYSYAKAKSGTYSFATNPQKGGVNTKTFVVKDGDVIVLELKTIWDIKNSMRAISVLPGADKELIRTGNIEFKQSILLPAKASYLGELAN